MKRTRRALHPQPHFDPLSGSLPTPTDGPYGLCRHLRGPCGHPRRSPPPCCARTRTLHSKQRVVYNNNVWEGGLFGRNPEKSSSSCDMMADTQNSRASASSESSAAGFSRSIVNDRGRMLGGGSDSPEDYAPISDTRAAQDEYTQGRPGAPHAWTPRESSWPVADKGGLMRRLGDRRAGWGRESNGNAALASLSCGGRVGIL